MEKETVFSPIIPPEERPEYMYNPAMCPCPSGAQKNCPRHRNCEACTAFHHSNPRSPYTACERKYRGEL